MTTLEGKIAAVDAGTTCAFCKGRTFRRSRLKFKDMGSLLALRYPVRCLSCSKRQKVGLHVARRAVPSTVRQVRTPESRVPWDGRTWSRPRDLAEAMEGEFSGDAGAAEASGTRPMAMPDLQGVRLPRVAQMPPGDGENLV